MKMSGNSNRKYWLNEKLMDTRLFWSRGGQNSSSRDANDVKFYEKRKIHFLIFLVLVIIYILLDVLMCSIAGYFYELCRILTSPWGESKYNKPKCYVKAGVFRGNLFAANA